MTCTLSACRSFLLAGALLFLRCGAEGEFGICGPNNGISVDNIVLSPAVPHTNIHLTVSILGNVPRTASALYAPALTVSAEILFCRRFQDCMSVFHVERPFCSLLGKNESLCGLLHPGEEFNASSSWHLPLLMIRGSYSAFVKFHSEGQQVAGCYELRGVEVLASRPINVVRDLRDATVAFLIAASSSRAIGIYFPVLSGGILPQITGFLLMGIFIGPYGSNLVSRLHIFLIGNVINRVALAFIAGAAGAEIFVPELIDLLAPMGLQVLLISGFTMLFCGPGLLILWSTGWVQSPAMDAMPNFAARGALALLVSALMTARSPASIIAVVSELNCGSSKAAKMGIGITVLSDIMVLFLFSLCTELVHVVLDGGGFGPKVLLGVGSELTASALLGLLTGSLLRCVLPPITKEESRHLARRKSSTEEMMAASDPSKDRRQSKDHGHGLAGKNEGPCSQAKTAARGALLIFILQGAFLIAGEASAWSNGHFRPEPLLACTIASCVAGHDQTRRERLLESLSFWTPHVLLPFFTLAGASLQLPGLGQVLPTACALVVLRMLGIAIGSSLAGVASRRVFVQVKGKRVTNEEITHTWLTLIAQAGVTLGLVLEVQSKFGTGWSRHFSTLVIGVVVLNQLLGPVLCRVGLHRILAAEEAQDDHEDDSSASSSEEETRSTSEGDFGLEAYDTLTQK